MTEDEDLARVCNDPESIYHKYESERISHLTRRLESSLDCCKTTQLSETESRIMARDIIPMLKKVIHEGETLQG